MANRPAQRLMLQSGDRPLLEATIRRAPARGGQGDRARILLLAADGLPNTHIAELVGVSRPTVLAWRHRYEQGGLEGLEDKPRLGRRRTIEPEALLDASIAMPPNRLGVTHWSSRLLGRELGVGRGAVVRGWHEYGLQPVRGGFRFATLPVLAGRMTDVFALRLGTAEHMVVLGVRDLARTLDPPRSMASTAALMGLRHRLGQASQDGTGDDPAEALLRFVDDLRRVRPAWPSGVTPHLVSDGRGPTADPELRNAFLARSGVAVHTVAEPGQWAAMTQAWLSMAVHRFPADARLADLPARFRLRHDERDEFRWAGPPLAAPPQAAVRSLGGGTIRR